MADRSNIKSWLTDMDGVLVHEGQALPGAAQLIKQWQDSETPFLVLTNNSIYTPRDLSARLRATGLDVPEDRIWTSALATAAFLHKQKPYGSAFVIGEAGMTTALHEIGYVQTDQNPDYVVLGESRNFNFDILTKAIRLINNRAIGRRRVASNRFGRCAHHQGDRARAIHCWQAKPDDVPLGDEQDFGALRVDRHDW